MVMHAIDCEFVIVSLSAKLPDMDWQAALASFNLTICITRVLVGEIGAACTTIIVN